ncbi:MAG: lipoate--protein ligase [Clostridiales bacterium]|nr:lipoate--protein ligase [Clostridiales bacterium]
MIRELYRIRANGSDPAHNLAVEEYLTRHTEPGQCILFLWQNKRTVVIGKNQNAWKECSVQQLEADGGHLVRRLSGGGAVYHDLGNLNFTFCVRREDYNISRQTDVILRAVKSLGIDAVKNGRNDLTVDGKKFSGHAFLKKGPYCYHHGTLMVDVDAERLIKYLRVDPLKLDGNGVDSVRARVTNLREHAPSLTIAALEQALTDSFSEVYSLPVKDLREEDLPAWKIDDLAAFYASWDWVFGRPLSFTHEMQGRYGWGGVHIGLKVKSGIVRDMICYSDGLEEGVLAAVCDAVKGCRYESDALVEAVLKGVGSAEPLSKVTAAQMAADLSDLIRTNAAE